MAIQIKLIKSAIGRPERQKATVKALGLRKLNHTITKEESPAVLGMVEKVKHLLEVKEV
ncbi:MAG: 50S ribosomal protein L30 [Candidatus Muirbacterium halophilum]|nr:50S ribosomal protein L30 [Candidatus Muirbacterium halophilum]MCK9475239.1 50S ribosomal protein L30 [Candidatus Muirbacterium halophilum]